MAKSLRSKSKLRAKSIKRKGEFAAHVDLRQKRIAEKLALEHQQKKQSEINKAEDGEAVEETKQEMDVDGQPKKVSTSGWRDSRKQIYKKTHMKKKKNKAISY